MATATAARTNTFIAPPVDFRINLNLALPNILPRSGKPAGRYMFQREGGVKNLDANAFRQPIIPAFPLLSGACRPAYAAGSSKAGHTRD